MLSQGSHHFIKISKTYICFPDMLKEIEEGVMSLRSLAELKEHNFLPIMPWPEVAYGGFIYAV